MKTFQHLSQKTIPILLYFFYLSYSSIAQSIKGQIVDSQTNSPVEYATISIASQSDSSQILGALADEKGNFTIEKVKPGKYIMKVSFIGYKNYRTDALNITANTPVFNIGKVKITNSSKVLEDVKVMGERDQMQFSIDKKVFEVDKNPVVAGGSASDVLKQIPSVTVDTDGNINVRGTGNITIWVNGKPFANAGTPQQVLDQLPASSIERVELITNPSARYDADGMGGIINIILKKNRADGMNGQVSSGFGTRDKYNESANNNYGDNKYDYNAINKYNGNASLNWKFGKWNFTSNYGYRYGQRWQSHNTTRDNYFATDSNFQKQTSAAELYSHNHLLNLGAEYSIDAKNTVDARITGGYNQNVEPERLTYIFQNSAKIDTQLRVRQVNKYEYAYNIDANLGYRKTFNTPGREFSASASASWSINYGNTGFNQISNFPLSPILNPAFPSISGTEPNNVNKIAVAQIDYVAPFGEKTRFEMGAKVTYRNFDNDLLFDSLSNLNGNTEKDNIKSNRFVYIDDVNAVYGIWNQVFPRGFSVQAGLRGEQTIRSVEQVTLQTKNETSFIDFFPTLHIAKKLENEQELKASYSRRINRPNPGNLNPFPSYNNPVDLVVGNPFLKPEYINSFELGYAKNWTKHSFIATGYFREIEGATQRIRTVFGDGTSVTEFSNVGFARNTGIELIAKNELFKWWNITSNINGFYIQVNAGSSNNANNINRESFTGNGRFTSNFKIWKGADLQVTGYYMLPIAIAQGSFYGMNGIDVGFKKDIIPQKAFVTINISDVFNTRQFNASQNSDNFSTDIRRKRETRVMTVNFTYKFGNESLNGKKGSKRSNQNNSDGGGGGGEF